MSSTRRRRMRAHQRRHLVSREAPRRRDVTTHPAPQRSVVDARAVLATMTAVTAVLAVVVILLLA